MGLNRCRRVAARLLIAAALVGVAPGLGRASPAAPAEAALTPEQQAEVAKLRKIAAEIKPRLGDMALPEAQAVLRLGKDYYYLDAADARRVLIEAWGNPPDQADGVLGLVFPKDGGFLGGWGAVITYEKTDFVPDGNASDADYDALLERVWSQEEAQNKARAAAGFPTSHLVGWAQPPQYDKAQHYLIWARDIKFAGSPVDTLNYDLRMLGRRGVLSLNIVDGMDNLDRVRPAAAALARTATFNAGQTYADFDPKIDKTASYGVAGLVAAGLGVAAVKKVGLLAILLVVLKKGFVVVLALLAGVGNWFRGLLGRKPAGAASAAGSRPLVWDPEPEPPTASPPAEAADPPPGAPP